MNSQQNFDSEQDAAQIQSQKNKILLIIAGVIIGGIVLMGSCVGYVAYLDVQKQAEEARIAKQKAEEEKREAQRVKEEAERKAAEEKRLKEEAEERERIRAEEERVKREEEERKAQEQAQAEAAAKQKLLEEEANRPKSEVSKVQMSTDTRLVRGEWDYGVALNGFVRNTGTKSADFKIVAFLSCSGGNYVRTQLLNFSAGETKSLSYFFDEPNFGDSLSNCQGRIVAEPL